MSTIGDIRFDLRVEGVAAGVIVARDRLVEPAGPDLLAEIAQAVQVASDRPVDEDRKKAVRNLLRYGRYKPTGRGKPASEYLLRSAGEARFPVINNLVDALNMVSLTSMLPISLIDFDRAGTTEFALRRGTAGEAYVFNQGGQTIGLEDLLLVSALPEDRPCANPVKDSMATKLVDGSTHVMAVIYASAELEQVARQATDQLAAAFAECGSVDGVHKTVLHPRSEV